MFLSQNVLLTRNILGKTWKLFYKTKEKKKSFVNLIMTESSTLWIHTSYIYLLLYITSSVSKQHKE